RGNTFNNALVEAAYMTGLQRNGDVVRLASYAPLLAHEAHVQWTPDAIWFDNDESWESADWQVQKMFGNNVGDRVVPSTFDGAVNDPQDVKGGVFLSTWNTSAAYDNVTVRNNDTGETVFTDDFADASKWAAQSGTWSVSGGRYVQSSTTTTDARSIVTGAYTKDWSNYTLELDATKLSGAEGFLVGFGATGANNFYWWNIGGWNNTRSVLQRADGGSASEVVALEGDSVATGTSYHLKVEVDGTTVRLYQDGVLKLTHDQVDASEQLFQVVTKDDATGDLVAKVVNTATSPVRTQVHVADAGIEPTGTVTSLTAPSRTATNTKAAPQLIWPKERAVSGLANDFEYEFPASSVTFLRMHTTDAVAPVVDDLSVDGTGVRGWYRDPATVHVAASDNRAVDHVEWSLDGGAWHEVDGAAADVEVAGDGVHELAVRAVDEAGNVGEVRPLTVGVDAAAPVTKASFDAAARSVTLTAADSGAGIGEDGTQYRLDNGPWTSYDVPVVVDATAHVVEFRSTDVFGNAEEAGRLELPAVGAVPASTTAAVAEAATVRLGSPVSVRVTVSGAGATPTGPVVLRKAGTVLASADLVSGRATLKVGSAKLGTGAHTLTVDYAGDATHGASSDTVTVKVVKASSRTTLALTQVASRAPLVTVRVSAAVAVSGKVTVSVLRDGRTVLTRSVSLTGGRGLVRLPRLPRGSHVVAARYAGSATVDPSTTRTAVRIP
ncbi:MAG TPA: alpha-L-arabinofuranosidase C-terminal domain-containing protein, partial [Nocardioides sp.]|nr:alpha-L-arabinofuranosidase C-terminal domain-containing protein [Nocardioides sp.]